MWNPVKSDASDQIILAYASQGISKELIKLNKKIDKISTDLLNAHDNNLTVKRRSSIRTKLRSECEQRDRLEKAMRKIDRVLNGGD